MLPPPLDIMTRSGCMVGGGPEKFHSTRTDEISEDAPLPLPGGERSGAQEGTGRKAGPEKEIWVGGTFWWYDDTSPRLTPGPRAGSVRIPGRLITHVWAELCGTGPPGEQE